MRNSTTIAASLAGAMLLLSGCSTLSKFFASSQKPSPAEQVLGNTQKQAETPQQNEATKQWLERRKAKEEEKKASESRTRNELPATWTPTESTEQASERFVNAVLDKAKSKLGCRYSYGSKGPNTFDCSGFTSYIYGLFGISLSPSSSMQAKQGRWLGKDEPLKPGDLVFFNGRRISKTSIGHVGMVVSYNPDTKEFTFIHAAVGAGVEIQKSTQQYYVTRYMGASRVLPDELMIENDVCGRDLRRTFYTIANNLSDGVGYDVIDSDKEGVKTLLFDNMTWATVKDSEIGLTRDPRNMLSVEYASAASQKHPVSTSRTFEEDKDSEAITTTTSENGEYYTIKSGDTLYSIALRHHTTVSKICSLNGISEKKTLQVGQKLRVK